MTANPVHTQRFAVNVTANPVHTQRFAVNVTANPASATVITPRGGPTLPVHTPLTTEHPRRPPRQAAR
ncbi:hypothetical protein [Candidatus Chloroploca asiatica]|uniref:Uncharacterized protein n=1 Tax=Candidatus Chloroploca asiatica TaxID=1506545 RepID=A0A2H3L9I9_9CHLR|nr:hypothetical protein [Candidatus Chloroploca asiatica]PDV98988.1 hypothetical protein A9Q02_14155 [Candidatus Chloroploca asiatica]